MNTPVIQAKKTRKKFDRTFKQHAVELWRNSGKTATEVAAELGIHAQRLSAWRERFAPPPPGGSGGGGAKRTAEQLEVENTGLRRENDYLRQQRDIFKKNFGHPLRTPEQRFQRIDAMKTEHPIRPLCEALEVSASGYYDWHHRQTHPSRRTRENTQLIQRIVQFHAASRQTYGSPRMQAELARAGHAYGRHRIARLMRQHGLCGRAKGRFRVRTADSHHDQPIAPNRLPALPIATPAWS